MKPRVGLMDYKKVEFVKTAIRPEDYPKRLLPEVAVVGRSNVGKSSLLNNLFCRKKMVKTSSTPGKTQALQFFLVDDRLSVVDLPGYGYSKVRATWAGAIETYFEVREQLKFILFLLDIRREPSPEDMQFIEWAHDLPYGVVITKADKIKRSQRKGRVDKIMSGLPDVPHILYSTEEKLGRQELIGMLDDIA